MFIKTECMNLPQRFIIAVDGFIYLCKDKQIIQMTYVKPKKHLGQHFLKDMNISKRIAETIKTDKYVNVLEIGPGTGVLTQFLLQDSNVDLQVIELDSESVDYLKENFPALEGRIIFDDFLKYDLSKLFNGESFVLIGNYPYNISSQIFFKALDNKERIPFISGMLQKEVAERLASKPGKKAYGILSVLLQAYYDIEYLFTVPPGVFNPPPKVDSAVICMRRNNVQKLDCDEVLFKTVIKTSFNQRRKTLRNSLKSIFPPNFVAENEIFNQRPEQLSVAEFVQLTKMLSI